MSSSFKLTSHKDEAISAMNQKVVKALTECGIVATGYAKDECPVDTGNLRNSLNYMVDNSEPACYIGTNVEYAPYVEMGTGKNYSGGNQSISGMKAHPYLKPAIANNGDKYKEIIKKELQS